MKNNKLGYLLILIIFAFGSCSKNTAVENPIAPTAPQVSNTLAITGFSKGYAFTGDELELVGVGFDLSATNNMVKVNGLTATVTKSTATSIVITIPALATSGKITVVVNGVLATSGHDFFIVPEVYKTIRLKASFDEKNNLNEYFYNALGQLETIKTYEVKDPANGVSSLKSITSFLYDLNGQLNQKISYEITNPTTKVIVDYQYDGKILKGYSLSNASFIDPNNPVTYSANFMTISYLGSRIQKMVVKDLTGKLINENSYEYKEINGDPNCTITYVTPDNPPIKNTTLYDMGVFDPYLLYVPGDLAAFPFLAKSYDSFNPKYSYTLKAQVETSGKVLSTTQMPIDGTQGISVNFIYEAKP